MSRGPTATILQPSHCPRRVHSPTEVLRHIRNGHELTNRPLRTLTRLSTDRHTDTRRVAVEALAKGWPGDPVALQTVLRLTAHPDWTTRRTAVYALADGWPKDSEARQVVIGLTADIDENVRDAASEVLGTIF
ncbi:HEAT repeat domain-containing protein [Streptomyces olivochromogenes]|uniref:HEAT repeat domain-containing protein n=1 Tax=Streptomyces olivochromogenes TaxID=1963 RepID=UPI0036D90D5B